MPNEPTDPMTSLAAGAVQVHELFLSYLEAGFTEKQSLYLVGQLLAAAVKGQTE